MEEWWVGVRHGSVLYIPCGFPTKVMKARSALYIPCLWKREVGLKLWGGGRSQVESNKDNRRGYCKGATI